MPLEPRRQRLSESFTWKLRRNWAPLGTISAVIIFLYLFFFGSPFGSKHKQSSTSNTDYQRYGWNEFLNEDSNQNMDLDLDLNFDFDQDLNLGGKGIKIGKGSNFPVYNGQKSGLEYLYSKDELTLDDPPAHLHSYKWDAVEDIPETRVFAHVPGHTVLHNVFNLNGVFYLVSERKRSIPPLKYILSSWAELPDGRVLVNPPTEANIRLINRITAKRLLGKSARFIRGTTWWNNDPLPYVDDSTILHFARTHHMQSHRLHFNMSLLPPDRIFYPRISDRIQNFASKMAHSQLFNSYRPDLRMVLETSAIPGVSFIPGLATLPGLASIPRLLFPGTGVKFLEDWNDYLLSGRPVLFESLVIIDSAASVRNPKNRRKSLASASALEARSPLAEDDLDSGLTKREYINAGEEAEQARIRLEIGSPLAPFRVLDNSWWSPWRDRMASIISIAADSQRSLSRPSSGLVPVSTTPVITYISRQGEISGRLHDPDHDAFVTELEGLVKRQGYEIQIVSPSRLTYVERVSIALRSTIIVGPTGPGLMDVMWMQPSSSALLVEIFPEDYVTSRHYTAAKTVGVDYLAWRGSRSFVPTMVHVDKSKRDHKGHGSEIRHSAHATDVAALDAALKVPININPVALCNELVERLEANHGHDDEDM